MLTALLCLQELNNYRAKCSLLFHYDWISIPLVYTQVGRAMYPGVFYFYWKYCSIYGFNKTLYCIFSIVSFLFDPIIVSLFTCAGCYYCRLLVFCLLLDWPTIPEPREGIQESQPGHVRPCVHSAAVLLLHRLAQGNTARPRITGRNRFSLDCWDQSDFTVCPFCRWGS